MKHSIHKIFVAALATAAFFAMLCWAGDIDFTEQVILHMSQHDYDTVRQHLTRQNGHEPSQSEIAHWWAAHHK